MQGSGTVMSNQFSQASEQSGAFCLSAFTAPDGIQSATGWTGPMSMETPHCFLQPYCDAAARWVRGSWLPDDSGKLHPNLPSTGGVPTVGKRDKRPSHPVVVRRFGQRRI